MRDTFNTNIWSWINIITFGVLIFLPYCKLLRKDYLKVNKYDLFSKEYKDCIDFTEDYERANPINQKEGKINYLKKLKERELISENEYQNCLKDIYNINIMQVYYKTKKINEKLVVKENNKDNVNNDSNKYNTNVNSDVNVDKNNNNNNNSNKINSVVNNASFASNVNMNQTKKKLKKKKKPLADNQLNLNKLNSSSSNDIFANVDGNKINQN